MTVLRESPWYQEILEEGREEGLERGLEQARRDYLRRVLKHRFGEVPADIEREFQELDLHQLERLFDVALEVETLDDFRRHLPPAGTGNGEVDTSLTDS